MKKILIVVHFIILVWSYNCFLIFGIICKFIQQLSTKSLNNNSNFHIGKMGKRKGKKAEKVDPIVQKKIEKLNDLNNYLKISVSSYIDDLNALSAHACSEIDKEYGNIIKATPQDIRNMTLAQLTQKLQEEDRVATPPQENMPSLLLKRAKMTTEKKKTIHKVDRKRSVSASAKPVNLLRPDNRISRAISESNLMTPVNNKMIKREPSFAVTPKFNVKLPVSKLARKARAGEIAMSISGSPLQVSMDNPVPTHKIALSLGNGRVLTFNDNGNIDKDLTENIDDLSKETLKNVMETLGEIIRG